jgi:integrase/recombinase XerD
MAPILAPNRKEVPMLDQLFPRVHRRYLSLPVFGPQLGDFAGWLFRQGYPRHRVRQHFRTTRRIEDALHAAGVKALGDLTREQLRACAPSYSWDNPELVATVRSLERYLDGQGLLPAREPPGKTETLVSSYETYLRGVRGLADSTVAHHRFTAGQFLQHLGYEEKPSRLGTLASADVESFIRTSGQRLSRASMQHVVAQLRAFLRFLATRGDVPPGLDAQIDTPRLYRGEQLPRSLPWETVRAFLKSIDQHSAGGMRDYAIFLLIVTYGLRASEIVSLSLDDVDWRAARIRVPQRKTRGPLFLPLTEEVGACLIQYLRQARPALAYRELFLRVRAPAGVLKPTAVTEAFQKWSKRSGLAISFQGPHCLRHSYAVRLLRAGTPLKTIGDLLGHRTAESTCVYLRLAVEDLRGVALPLPKPPGLDADRKEMP